MLRSAIRSTTLGLDGEEIRTTQLSFLLAGFIGLLDSNAHTEISIRDA